MLLSLLNDMRAQGRRFLLLKPAANIKGNDRSRKALPTTWPKKETPFQWRYWWLDLGCCSSVHSYRFCSLLCAPIFFHPNQSCPDVQIRRDYSEKKLPVKMQSRLQDLSLIIYVSLCSISDDLYSTRIWNQTQRSNASVFETGTRRYHCVFKISGKISASS